MNATSAIGAIIPPAIGALGVIAAVVAIAFERRMHRHRQPGVSYWQATWRRDGGWRRDDLFTPEGLTLQREAARWGWTAGALWLAAIVAWIAL